MIQKKITIGLLALGVSGIASAAYYVPECTGDDVTLPCTQGLKVGADFIYVQPTGGITPQPAPVGAANFTDGSNLKWAPGVRAEAGYLFGSGHDATLNFTWFGNTGNRVINDVSESIEDRFWDINGEFGRTALFGNNGNVVARYHGGFKYANIRRDYNPAVFGPNEGTAINNQRFQGFGPRVGVDTEYMFDDSGFSLVGKVAASLLVGDAKVNSTEDGVVACSLSTRTIVPAFEGRLGAKYTFGSPELMGDLAIEGGYQWAGYYQTMHNLFDADNYGYHGIYVGLKWLGDVLV